MLFIIVMKNYPDKKYCNFYPIDSRILLNHDGHDSILNLQTRIRQWPTVSAEQCPVYQCSSVHIERLLDSNLHLRANQVQMPRLNIYYFLKPSYPCTESVKEYKNFPAKSKEFKKIAKAMSVHYNCQLNSLSFLIIVSIKAIYLQVSFKVVFFLLNL